MKIRSPCENTLLLLLACMCVRYVYFAIRMQERGGRTNLQCKQQKKDGKFFFFAFFTSFPFCTRAHNVRSYKTPKKKGDTCLERLRETGIFFVTSYIIPLFPSLPPSPRQKVGPFSGPIHPPAYSSVPLGSLSLPRRNYGGRLASSSFLREDLGEELSRKR